jgi:hypothetical protein
MAGPQPESASPSRVTIEWQSSSPDHVMQFPTSITERGDRVAAMISIDSNRESFELEWLVFKNVNTDKIEGTLDLMDLDLSLMLDRDCRNWPEPCIHMDEVNRRVAEANVVLAKDRWRPIPCFYGAMQPERDEPACDRFTEGKRSPPRLTDPRGYTGTCSLACMKPWNV